MEEGGIIILWFASRLGATAKKEKQKKYSYFKYSYTSLKNLPEGDLYTCNLALGLIEKGDISNTKEVLKFHTEELKRSFIYFL
ncbi:MAG TPA: hypothetical protein VNX01_15695 [Bacteroidia bacterium]|nr:hypothetical protein [Bacteroidia bacterium]